MVLSYLRQEDSRLARAMVVVLVVAFLVPSLTASAKPRKRRGSRAAAPQVTRLVIWSTTEAAEVEIDGRVVGETPMEEGLSIDPGEHTIRVSKRGWSEHIDTFRAWAGDTVELEIDLIPVAGIVRIRTQAPGATVEVNGKVVGITPFDQDIPIGKVSIRVAQSGFHDLVKSLEIEVDHVYDLDLSLDAVPLVRRPPPGEETLTDRWWFWTALGGAVAGSVWAVAALISADQPGEAPVPHTTILIP